MRGIGLLFVLVGGTAAADFMKPAEPKPDKQSETSKLLSDFIKEAQRPRGIDGVVASGIVITPKPHPDDRPYPEGAVITPPDPNDPMNLELGTNALRDRVPREPWLPRDLSRGIQRGADAVWDWVLPKL